jgi:hypothetical protein
MSCSDSFLIHSLVRVYIGVRSILRLSEIQSLLDLQIHVFDISYM